MNAKTLTAIVLLMAAVPAASFAQSATMPFRPTPPTLDFAAADSDGSGGISVEEWSVYATGLHDQMRAQMIGARADALLGAGDANADGALNRDELVTGMTALGDQRRAAADEGRGPMGGMISRFMHRHDGGHERGGWGGERGGDHQRGGMRGDGQGPMGGQRGEGRGPMDGSGPMMDGQRGGPGGDMGFRRIDDNGDGQIDAAELAQAQAMINWMAQRPVRN